MFTAILSQLFPLLPLALAVYISFFILRATDLTLDGSFVLGAAVFAKMLELNYAPMLAGIAALTAGMLAGTGVALIQRKQKIDSLLAGILATFVLLSVNLLIMGRPNISLLAKVTLVSTGINASDLSVNILSGAYSSILCLGVCLILVTRYGLLLRAFGDNPNLLHRLGKNVETHRIGGFALTNSLAAASGCLTAQTIGYADIGMGFGLTLTALGAVILGQQLLQKLSPKHLLHGIQAFAVCLLGVAFYLLATNGLLRLNLNPIYLKMVLGLTLIMFLRTANICTTKRIYESPTT
ncbi:MAG: ABC transporter permease [Gammaproteobacteria bacterium]